MRLIDADKLIEQKFKNPISYAAFCNLVKRQMTVDAVPVVHGRWTIADCHAAMYPYCCSNCTAHHRARYDFCPSCGAKMDGKDGDEGG